MRIEEYFSNRVYQFPNFGSAGIQSDWLSFCNLKFKSGRFLVVDVEFTPLVEQGLVIGCPPDNYLVEVKAIDYDGGQFVSRLRVIKEGSNPTMGNLIGETWTDTAMTAVCDLGTLQANWGDEIEYLDKYIRPKTHTASYFGIAKIKEREDLMLPFVISGFGDGAFPVYEPVDEGNRVGFEVEFIDAREGYPYYL